MGIVLTGVQCSRRCLFSMQLSYAGIICENDCVPQECEYTSQ